PLLVAADPIGLIGSRSLHEPAVDQANDAAVALPEMLREIPLNNDLPGDAGTGGKTANDRFRGLCQLIDHLPQVVFLGARFGRLRWPGVENDFAGIRPRLEARMNRSRYLDLCEFAAAAVWV